MSNIRRSLEFKTLDEVISDANQLLSGGYAKTGNWDLSQTCSHLNDWMSYSMDGYPKAPLPIRLLLWLMKTTSGKRQFVNVLKNGFRDRLPTVPESVHPAGEIDDSGAAGQLTDTIDRFKQFTGPLHPSPLYGELTHDEVVKLQLVHCAHHLRLLVPKS